MSEDFGDQEATEALKLIRAFYKIKDLDTRRIIVSIVEAAARGATVKIESPPEPTSWHARSTIRGENTQ